MDFLKEFNRLMETTTNLSLATSENNIPDVRIMTFFYDPKNQGTAYISTFKQAPKTQVFLNNNKVAFTTIPVGSSEFVRVTGATIEKSALSIYDLKEGFIKKFPDYAVTIERAGAMLEIYEIHFTEAHVTLGMGTQGNIKL